MLKYQLLIPAAVAFASTASAQTDARRADSTLATLVTRNGEMRLVLTRRSLRVGFTAVGTRRIRRAADSAFAAKEGRARPGRPDAAPAPPDGHDDAAGPEKAGSEKPFPLRDVQDIRASGDSLLVCFATRPPAAEPCGMWHRFLVTGVAPPDAQRFAEAVRRARVASLSPRN